MIDGWWGEERELVAEMGQGWNGLNLETRGCSRKSLPAALFFLRSILKTRSTWWWEHLVKAMKNEWRALFPGESYESDFPVFLSFYVKNIWFVISLTDTSHSCVHFHSLVHPCKSFIQQLCVLCLPYTGYWVRYCRCEDRKLSIVGSTRRKNHWNCYAKKVVFFLLKNILTHILEMLTLALFDIRLYLLWKCDSEKNSFLKPVVFKHLCA